MKKVLTILSIIFLSFTYKSNGQCNGLAQELCFVTADTITYQYPVIGWEKLQNSAIDSFIIFYFEPSMSQFMEVTRRAYQDKSEFAMSNFQLTDTTYSAFFKICYKDTCGNISDFSQAHQPVRLIYTGNGVFNFTRYLVNGIEPAGTIYKIYKNTSGIPVVGWNYFTTVPMGTTSFNDPQFSLTPGAEYHVRVELPYSCDVGNKTNPKALASWNTSKSNIKNLSVTSIENSTLAKNIKVYPNPVADILNIANPSHIQINEVRIANTLGEVVKTSNQYTGISVSGLSKGVYFVSITTPVGTLNRTLIKE